MPVNGYSVGRDISVVLIAQNPGGGQTTFALNGITDYAIKPQFTKLKHKGLDGDIMQAAIPDGWDLNIKIDRTDDSLDAYFAMLETAYFAGQDIPGATITESIQEVDGSVSQNRYDSVSLVYDDAGSWKGDSLIAVSLSGMAARRTKTQ